MVVESAMRSRLHPSNAWLALAGAALLSIGTVGCAPQCGEGQTIRYEEGITDPTGTVYQTTPVRGPFLHFPPSRAYELVHGLRGDPVTVDIHLSFDENGKLSPSAGNQSIWRVDTSDAGEPLLIVTNDTCGEFYIYVVASIAPLPPTEADAGGGD